MILEVEFDFGCPDLYWADLLEKSFMKLIDTPFECIRVKINGSEGDFGIYYRFRSDDALTFIYVGIAVANIYRAIEKSEKEVQP